MSRLGRRLRRFAGKVISLNSSPHGIALGFALGFALSVIPAPWVGMFLALALAPVLRANPAATYLGTMMVNPLNGVFVYGLDYLAGCRLLGRACLDLEVPDSLGGIISMGKEMVLPLYLGALLVALLAGSLSYLLVIWGVRWWRRRHPGEGNGLQEAEEA